MTTLGWILFYIFAFLTGILIGLVNDFFYKLDQVSILKEKGGVISKDPVWVAADKKEPFLYISPTYLGLVRQLMKEWRHDKHLAGY